MKGSTERYIVGIDLGTTHTVVAYAAPGEDTIQLFEIEQLVAPGQVAALPLLPSLRYHPATEEFAPADLHLPWSRADEPAVVGTLARRLGAQVPGRLVASAKSWLSHTAVDRTAPILPWGAPEDVPKVSPLEASASYLAHVRHAWNARFAEAPLERQDIVLTIPASFDEGARALTLEAARMAGLGEPHLVEEPQAALQDWLHRHRATLAADLAGSRLILVADVGGGTTDFSLIRVRTENGAPVLDRIGVGQHLMLGGDNMDLVLARLAESRLAPSEPGAAPQRLSASRLSQLTDRCRAAKETLLAADAPESAPITLLGGGSRLIGGSRSTSLGREEARQLLVDGFFPEVPPDETLKSRRGALVEFGLPYASDPAITRHLSDFLCRHADDSRAALGDASNAGMPVPDALLLNGGVFRAEALAERLQSVLAGWRGQPLALLHNDDPDIAVARGAVAYGLARRGSAPRIGGGAARSYFLALEGGEEGICILPRGSAAGAELVLEDRVFGLQLGQPVRFPLASSTGSAQAGQIVSLESVDAQRLPPISTVLPADAGRGKQQIEVRLAAMLTEVGTLQLSCVAVADPQRRWRLEFGLRGAEESGTDDARLPANLPAALERIDRVFGARGPKLPEKEVRQLRLQLEKLLGSRERWDLPLSRRLFDAFMKDARGRRRSADHERIWLNLAGYCLRPGTGYPLDDWRIAELWKIFPDGVQHRADNQVAAEWWTLWRRAAGGLPSDAQLRLLEDFAFNVQADAQERKRRPATLVPGKLDDMLRLAAALERIPGAYKVEIGDWMMEQLRGNPDQRLMLWALGRVGARMPFYGSAHETVAPENASSWLEWLLSLDWRRIEPAAFAAAHIARLTGDRSRDLPDDLREKVAAKLAAIGAAPNWTAMLREVIELDEADQQRALGDSLPPGLRLLR
ncbi:Hsp70 family protein [Noviherbaspirillum pedocola]|uniref:Hsp70 family protein n=1 Tax=Noviherbaspirillum pedocola TaxID=2801341 RepID=A0A934W6V7_9BURK|nr:Hsp70 family protein [Noviherbaspirillum pedocola]MBK4735610.1 hsp70 family protein [Noviherbaspirillum pedocola]